MTVRVVPLRSDEAADARVEGTPAERLALLAELSRRMWVLTGRPIPIYAPIYARSRIPLWLATLDEQ